MVTAPYAMVMRKFDFAQIPISKKVFIVASAIENMTTSYFEFSYSIISRPSKLSAQVSLLMLDELSIIGSISFGIFLILLIILYLKEGHSKSDMIKLMVDDTLKSIDVEQIIMARIKRKGTRESKVDHREKSEMVNGELNSSVVNLVRHKER